MQTAAFRLASDQAAAGRPVPLAMAPGNVPTRQWFKWANASPEFLGFWRDRLQECAAQAPEARSVVLRGADGVAFMGLVRHD